MSGFWRDGFKKGGRLRSAVDRPKLKKPALTRTLRLERQCALFRDSIKEQTAQILRDASALSTQKTAGSHWSFWTLFVDWAGIYVDLFVSSADPPHSVLKDEEDALIAFKATFCLYPRTKQKQTKKGTRNGRNTSRYAAQCVSTVRTHYEKAIGRVVGLRGDKGQSSHRMMAVSKGLAKLDPLPTDPRPPLLSQHMLAIRTQCDLACSEADRVGWAFSLTCWAGCNRHGDILASAERTRKALSEYDPFFHTHRGRAV